MLLCDVRFHCDLVKVLLPSRGDVPNYGNKFESAIAGGSN